VKLSEPAIAVHGVTKRYGKTVAVDDVSFEVAAGSVFAFVGTNGAGKSTTISCLTSVTDFDHGEVRVAGHDVRKDGDAVRAAIGVVFQESILDPLLTARENLRVRGRFYSADGPAINARIAELSALIGLGDFLDRRYGKFSGGERRRVDIARALMQTPSIIFLDEPTAGLDLASRAQVWSTIQELRDRHGLTVFLTTHYLEETEEADQVCLIDHGRIVAEGTPAQLRAKYSRSVLTVTSRDPAALASIVARAGRVIEGDGDLVRIAVDTADEARAILAAHDDSVADFEFRHGTMDDVFLALTGGTADPNATGAAA
jgi:multidrug/hemolysin transport system ATP-binding protein